MDIVNYNREAWDKQTRSGCKWSQPVDQETIERARRGEFEIVLTPIRPVPADWFPDLNGCDVLCLACGGGQQAPILAAAGANVTVLDNSPEQLAQDGLVAERDGLEIKLVQGDMQSMTCFDDQQFDFIFHPCSISFVPEPQKVFSEVSRVLRNGGSYVVGFCNPFVFVFDYDKLKEGELVVRHSIPYSDVDSLNKEELDQFVQDGEPLCFGHSLESLIGGQLKAGMQITGFFEDKWGDMEEAILDSYLSTMVATRAVKPA